MDITLYINKYERFRTELKPVRHAATGDKAFGGITTVYGVLMIKFMPMIIQMIQAGSGMRHIT